VPELPLRHNPKLFHFCSTPTIDIEPKENIDFCPLLKIEGKNAYCASQRVIWVQIKEIFGRATVCNTRKISAELGQKAL